MTVLLKMEKGLKLKMTLKTSKQLAPTKDGVNGFGGVNKKLKITIHLTGNRSKGANAKMHANLQSRVYGASWHWQVDDKEAIQSFEHTWQCFHAGDGAGNGNKHSIGIEGCINSDGDYVKSVTNMAELTAKICKQENLDPVKDVVRHYDWSGKHCPSQIMDGWYGITWAKFKQMVLEFYRDGNATVKPVSTTTAKKNTATGGIVKRYSEKGVFYPNETIIVRDQPSTKGNIIVRYYKGENLTYHTVHIGNGYVWLEYLRNNGKSGFIPIREYKSGKFGKLWGTIK